MTSSVPSFKVENTDAPIKPEPLDDASSPIASDVDGEGGGGYMDDTEVDDPELDLKSARQDLWITRVPHYMWDVLAQAKDDDEIELGTIRVEGSVEQPSRVSLMLNALPRFAGVEKEYRLDVPVAPLRKSRRPGRTMVFSEKDKPGYKAKTWAWDDVDEDGNPGQGRSYLYEAQRREERKKESKGKYTPYARRPIPKITSIAGTVVQEFDLKPVDNDEHAKLETKRRETMLAGNVKMYASKDNREELSFIRDSAPRHAATVLTAGEKASMQRQQQQKKQARKEDRTTRMEKTEIIDALLRCFREFRFYGLRTLRTKLKQPEQWIKENLEEIAIMHRAGDFNGKWELKDEYKNQDESLMNAAGEAKGEDSDIDMLKSEGEDEDEFEDV